jgi:hypothetical protein
MQDIQALKKKKDNILQDAEKREDIKQNNNKRQSLKEEGELSDSQEKFQVIHNFF